MMSQLGTSRMSIYSAANTSDQKAVYPDQKTNSASMSEEIEAC
jgi:hypothetical protein